MTERTSVWISKRWLLPDNLLSHGDAEKRITEPPAGRFSMERKNSDNVLASPTKEHDVTDRC